MPSLFLKTEGEMFVQKIADDTTKEIIRGRRYPIAHMSYIIEYKHNSGTYYGVDYSHHHKFGECKMKDLYDITI